jgi:transposase-like protein
MLGHGAKFGHKKEQAIAALLSYRSVEEAARAVGISANTLLRWMKEPEFEAVCREARRTVFSQAIGRLQDAAGAAATTVLKIMVDPNVPSGTRLRAAEVVLEQAAKAGEMEDIENRVATLERTAGLARKSRKRSADLTWLSVTSLPCPTTTRGQIAAPPLDSTETDEDVIE